MATKKKMLQAAAGQATGGAALDITDVFSTYLYTGNGSAQTITNGIDLSGEGGLVWIKDRDNSGYIHNIYDTERGLSGGFGLRLQTDATSAEAITTGTISSFNGNGFSLGDNAFVNNSGSSIASWTFRKAPKFFDVVTWTSSGSSSQEIAHDLGVVPGCIIVKRTDSTSDWYVWHLKNGLTDSTTGLSLNASSAAGETSWNVGGIGWISDAAFKPHSGLVKDDAGSSVPTSGTYVAYLFAHNDGDGGFGPDADQDIIKCGSYTGNGSGDGPEIDLGFEPQWVMIKNTTNAKNWYIFDSMRGMTVGGNNASPVDQELYADNSGSEQSFNRIAPTPNGFKLEYADGTQTNGSGNNYIYMAIRRGPLAQPESGTEVFAIDTLGGTSPNPPDFYSGWPVDMSMFRRRSQTANWATTDRLRGPTAELRTNSTEAEQFIGDVEYDQMTGYYDDNNVVSDIVSWMWKRAPGFFDVVAYTGNSITSTAINHNLGVAPEMIWVKNRGQGTPWKVLVNLSTYTDLKLNATDAGSSIGFYYWGDSVSSIIAPTADTFTVGSQTEVNASGSNYIAYLFASLPGISKVGSYTGNGSSQTIDCGFTSGARFVLIKRTDSAGDWHVWDSTRGIVSGNDSYLELNTTEAENTSYDNIDPHSSGFIVNEAAGADINGSGSTFIFYAIA